MPNLAEKIGIAVEDRIQSWWEEITGAFETRIKELEARIANLETKVVAKIEPPPPPPQANE